jgi:hypothetical protein
MEESLSKYQTVPMMAPSKQQNIYTKKTIMICLLVILSILDILNFELLEFIIILV